MVSEVLMPLHPKTEPKLLGPTPIGSPDVGTGSPDQVGQREQRLDPRGKSTKSDESDNEETQEEILEDEEEVGIPF